MIREGSVTTDDLNAPLGQHAAGKQRLKLPFAFPHAAAGVLGLFVVIFALWALIVDEPLGGEPTAIVMADPPSSAAAKIPAAGPGTGPARYDGPDPSAAA